MQENYPSTIDEAENRLSELTLDDKHRRKNSNEEDLVKFHFGLGMGIRNEFGL